MSEELPAKLISARRPRHLTLGEEMDVEVRNGFAGVGTIVDHEAETGGELEFFRDEIRDVKQVAEHGFVGGGRFRNARNQLLGDDEQVDGGLRLDVVEDEAEVVFVFDLGGNRAVDDALEDGFHRRGTRLPGGHTEDTEEFRQRRIRNPSENRFRLGVFPGRLQKQ